MSCLVTLSGNNATVQPPHSQGHPSSSYSQAWRSQAQEGTRRGWGSCRASTNSSKARESWEAGQAASPRSSRSRFACSLWRCGSSSWKGCCGSILGFSFNGILRHESIQLLRGYSNGLFFKDSIQLLHHGYVWSSHHNHTFVQPRAQHMMLELMSHMNGTSS
jgi:hypothetical protein